MGEVALITEDRERLWDDGGEVRSDVVTKLVTLGVATCPREKSSLSPYLNGTGILAGLGSTPLRRLIATPEPVIRESIETALSCVPGSICSFE